MSRYSLAHNGVEIRARWDGSSLVGKIDKLVCGFSEPGYFFVGAYLKHAITLDGKPVTDEMSEEDIVCVGMFDQLDNHGAIKRLRDWGVDIEDEFAIKVMSSIGGDYDPEDEGIESND